MTEKQVAKLLISMGVEESLSGFDCILQALLLIDRDPSVLISHNKFLYPRLGKQLGTSSIGAYKRIHYAREHMFAAMSPQKQKQLFGRTFRKAPSNKQFLDMLQDILSREVHKHDQNIEYRES